MQRGEAGEGREKDRFPSINLDTFGYTYRVWIRIPSVSKCIPCIVDSGYVFRCIQHVFLTYGQDTCNDTSAIHSCNEEDDEMAALEALDAVKERYGELMTKAEYNRRNGAGRSSRDSLASSSRVEAAPSCAQDSSGVTSPASPM